MKKKALIAIIMGLVIIGLVTGFLDNTKVRNNLEPQYTIKIVNEDGSRITYLGLGYKVIRYVGVSPNEPFKNNIGVKYGSWFMNYEFEEEPTITSAYANWAENTGDLGNDENCLNVDKWIFSDIQHLPVFKFEEKEQLDEFKDKYKDTFTMSQGYSEVSAFNDVTVKYDDEFFKNHTLMLVYVEASSSSFRYTISDVKKEDKTLVLKVAKTENPETYDSAMSGWFLMAELNKEYIKDCTEFDAQGEK